MTAHSPSKPLCVDLDGTLVRTDLLVESLLLLLKHKPHLCLLVPLWLLRGRAHLKRAIARRVVPDVESLPFSTELLAWVRSEHAQGRRIVLATGSDEILASKIAAHCGLFSEVIASDGITNMTGNVKRDHLVQRFGEKGFVYAGNSRVDLGIWSQAAAGIVVNGSSGLVSAARERTPVLHVFSSASGRLKAIAKAIRVHQWIKNVLVFVPLIAAHQLIDPPTLKQAVLAFFSFCSCASAIYVLNDLMDLEADRVHPGKCHRPFACGNLPVTFGLALVPILVSVSLACGWPLGGDFLLILSLYLALSVSYSFFIKRIELGDVMCLAGLYTIRVFGGAVATKIPVSNWLLAFAVFFFLSLALAKRASELFHSRASKRSSPKGRGYRLEDLEPLSSMGSGSGYISVLVLALYISSAEVTAFYDYPERLWFLCPLVFYWISRIWLLTHRGEIHEDPLVFALKDKVSYGVGLVTCLVLLLATGIK